MTRLFRLDIASIVYTAAKRAGAGFDLTLTKVEVGNRDNANLTAGKAKTEVEHKGYGIVEKGMMRYQRTLVPIEGAMITIYAKSLGGVKPEVNDRIDIGGQNYTIAEVFTDPADATFRCRCP